MGNYCETIFIVFIRSTPAVPLQQQNTVRGQTYVLPTGGLTPEISSDIISVDCRKLKKKNTARITTIDMD